MANYQELLSKAVGALPENNGASRREVYEKARKALVAQLRSISPALPAREITQHRLELEDCIRQVEHEATEALLGGLKELDEETIPLVEEEPPAALVEPEVIASPETGAEPVSENKAAVNGVDNVAAEAGGDVALAEKPVAAKSEPGPEPAKERPQSKVMAKAEPTSIDDIIARAEAAREKTAREATEKQTDIAAIRQAQDEAEAMTTAEKLAIEEAAAENSSHGQADGAAETAKDTAANKPQDANTSGSDHQGGAHQVSDAAVGAAMSRVREVEVEAPVVSGSVPAGPTARKEAHPVNNIVSAKATSTPLDDPQEDEAQLAVDRAIQVLDREARGEHDLQDGEEASLQDALGANRGLTSGEARFGSEGEEEKSGNALSIFLILAIVLLSAVGGGGYWAWREGYVDLDAFFASTETPVAGDASTSQNDGTPDVQPADPTIRDVTADAQNPGPGNTTTDVEPDVPEAEIGTVPGDGKIDERLPSAGTDPNDPASANGNANGDKVEDRLTSDTQPELTVSGQTGDSTVTGVASSGAQSLLLEASPDGTTGAVPFSGTVEWSRGIDELGQPTLIGTANIPARNLGVKVLIRRNADPTLPASHLMEIDFEVSETFSGGAVAGLPGILLKNEELVQGTALVGASARVVGNSFLFALSAAEQDVRNNISLLETNKWMDLAIVFATGRRAIITLEKDAAAQTMFSDVLAAWRAADASNGSGG